jgi:WD40 repeat protein
LHPLAVASATDDSVLSDQTAGRGLVIPLEAPGFIDVRDLVVIAWDQDVTLSDVDVVWLRELCTPLPPFIQATVGRAVARCAIVIGVWEYAAVSLPPVPTALRNAEGVRDVLAGPTVGVASQDMLYLENPTRQELAEYLLSFPGACRADLLILYFTGYGAYDGGDLLSMLGSDTDPTGPGPGGVTNLNLQDWAIRSGARRTLLIFDIVVAPLSGLPPAGDIVLPVRYGPRPPGSAIAVLDLTRRDGSTFESSMPEGMSWATDALVTGLSDPEADLDRDGRISIRELREYIDAHINMRVGDRGIPIRPLHPKLLTWGSPNEDFFVATVPHGPEPAAEGKDRVIWLSAGIQCLAPIAGQEQIICGCTDGSLVHVDIGAGRVLARIAGHSHAVATVAVTSDGKTVVSGSRDQTIVVWDIESGKARLRLQDNMGAVHALALLPDDRHLVSGSDDGVIRLWDLETGSVIRGLKGHRDTVYAVAVLADGRLMLSGSQDKTLRLWDLSSGSMLMAMQGHRNRVGVVVALPDGHSAVSGSNDKTLRLWDLKTGAKLRDLQGLPGRVLSAAIQPDGQRLFVGCSDGGIYSWDMRGEAFNGNGERHEDHVTGIAVMGDGSALISGSADRCLHVWSLRSKNAHVWVPPPRRDDPEPSMGSATISDSGWFQDVVDAPWCPQIVALPKGRFLMGAPEGDSDARRYERPQHLVTFDYSHPICYQEAFPP